MPSGRHPVRPLVLVLSLAMTIQTSVLAQQPAADSTARQDSSVNSRAFRLAPLKVVGEREGYRVPRTATLTKTDPPLRAIPQSISVLTAEVIGDRPVASLAALVRFVPGVTMGQGEGHRDQPTIRGNNSTSDLYVDGVRAGSRVKVEIEAVDLAPWGVAYNQPPFSPLGDLRSFPEAG